MVVGNHQHRQIDVNLVRDIECGLFIGEVARYQSPEGPLGAQERKDLFVCRIDRDECAIKLKQ